MQPTADKAAGLTDMTISLLLAARAASASRDATVVVKQAPKNQVFKAEAVAAEQGQNIALGVRESLRSFAKSVKGVTYETWGTGDFKKQFLETINNTSNKMHFNLDGVGNVFKAVAEGSKGFEVSQHVTSWELFEISKNASILERTTFT